MDGEVHPVPPEDSDFQARKIPISLYIFCLIFFSSVLSEHQFILLIWNLQSNIYVWGYYYYCHTLACVSLSGNGRSSSKGSSFCTHTLELWHSSSGVSAVCIFVAWGISGCPRVAHGILVPHRARAISPVPWPGKDLTSLDYQRSPLPPMWDFNVYLFVLYCLKTDILLDLSQYCSLTPISKSLIMQQTL